MSTAGQARFEKATPTDIKSLRKHVEDGEPFVSKSAPRLVVDADVIRELVLHAEAPSGVQISGIAISRTLNLADARGVSGAACNALILEDSALLGEGRHHPSAGHPGLDACHSHLQRLSLLRCRADGVELSSAVVVGDVNLNELGPLADDDFPPWVENPGVDDDHTRRYCWVKARGIRVGGSLTARRAKLSLPWRPSDDWPPPSQDDRLGAGRLHHASEWSDLRAPFALDLQGAQLGGSLILYPGFKALGGVNIATATIGGDLRARGAYLETARVGVRSIEALRANSVEIHGRAELGREHGPGPDEPIEPDFRRFEARGTLDFSGAKVGGPFVLSGAKVTGTGEERIRALNLSSSTLSAGVYLRRDERADEPCDIPTIDLTNAAVGGELEVEGSDGIPIQCLDATGLRAAGDVTVAGSLSVTDLSGSDIDGQLALGRRTPRPERVRSLKEERISGRLVTESVTQEELPVREYAPAPLRLETLSLTDARVGRDLKVTGVSTPIFPVTIDLRRQPRLIRTVGLACYPKLRLGEALFGPTSGSGIALLAFLYEPVEEARGADRLAILDGISSPIHDANDEYFKAPTNAQEVVEYLTFFCAHVWGAEGAFPLRSGSVEVISDPASAPWVATAEVAYGSYDLYKARFQIEATGQVEMRDDEHIGPAPHRWRRRYESPIRWLEWDDVEWPVPPLVGRASAWRGESSGSDLDIWPALREQLRAYPETMDLEWDEEWERPTIDLAGLRVASLADDDGRGWFGLPDDYDYRKALGTHNGSRPTLQLSLSGFEYDRISDRRGVAAVVSANVEDFNVSSAEGLEADVPVETALAGDATVAMPEPDDASQLGSPLDVRRYWLKAQHTTGLPDPPDYDEYRPQPYQHLAKVWRAAGEFDAADDIAHDKLELEKVLLSKPAARGRARIWRWAEKKFWLWCVQKPFGYGLKPWQALKSFAVYWAVGIVAMFALSGALKVDASPVATVVSDSAGGERVVVEKQQITEPSEEISCGDHVNKVIYPLDVMIPLVDLRQESRCLLSIKSGWFFLDWSLLKGLYAVLGWLVLVGVIVTWSGVVRRRIEG